MIIVTLLLALAGAACSAAPPVDTKLDADGHALTVTVDGKDALVYRFGPDVAFPRWLVNSPSGKPMVLEFPPRERFPHHQALWIADRVQMVGQPDVDFYHEWKNLKDPKEPARGHRHFITGRVVGHAVRGATASVKSAGQWLVNGTTPVLDDERVFTVTPLGGGEYLLDIAWTLTAAHGEVKFTSDAVHYAWPYVRIHPAFNGENGGAITSDSAAAGQKDTDMKPARWIDYSATVDGVTEGMAVFVFPDGQGRKWLTREYGTFGPRRPDATSGTKFTLKRGESLAGRVGILVHKGDVKAGRVAERFEQYTRKPAPAFPVEAKP